MVHHFREFPENPPPEGPNTNQHQDCIDVVQELGTHKQGVKQTKKTSSLRPRPAQCINLISLRQVFGPMGQHYEHEHTECARVRDTIQLLIKY